MTTTFNTSRKQHWNTKRYATVFRSRPFSFRSSFQKEVCIQSGLSFGRLTTIESERLKVCGFFFVLYLYSRFRKLKYTKWDELSNKNNQNQQLKKGTEMFCIRDISKIENSRKGQHRRGTPVFVRIVLASDHFGKKIESLKDWNRFAWQDKMERS